MSTVNFEEEISKKSTESISKTNLIFEYLNQLYESKRTNTYDEEVLFKIMSLATDIYNNIDAPEEDKEAFFAKIPNGDYPFSKKHKDIDLIHNRSKADLINNKEDFEKEVVKGYKLWNS